MNLNRAGLLVAGGIMGVALVLTTDVLGGSVASLTQFVSGTTALASEVNANFEALRLAINDNDARVSQLENPFDIRHDGDPVTSGAALGNAVTQAGVVASVDNPVLITLSAGVYERTAVTNLPAYVSLRGASRRSTRITFGIGTGGNNEVSQLAVDGPLYIDGNGVIAHDIKLERFRSHDGFTWELHDFEIRCPPGSTQTGPQAGMWLNGQSKLIAHDGQLSCTNATPGAEVRGVDVTGNGTQVWLANIRVWVDGPANDGVGLYAGNLGLIRVQDSTINSSGAVDVGGPGGHLLIRNSFLQSTTATAITVGSGYLYLVDDFIAGTIQPGAALVCLNNWDSMGAVTCP